MSSIETNFGHFEESLMHYGTPRHSGRYPWGSGDNPYQRTGDFLSRVRELKKQGLSEKEIAEAVGLKNTTQLRVEYRNAKNERRRLQVAQAKSMREDGATLDEIAKELGLPNESSVRSLLNPHSEEKMNQAQKTADFLKEQVDKKGMIDVGIGVERDLGISTTKLEEALYILKLEGYEVHGGRIPNPTNPSHQTTQTVLCPPGTPHKAIYDYGNVHMTEPVSKIDEVRSHDDGETFDPVFVYPASMNSKRMMIRYAEDGGQQQDGVIELRRNVPDLDLGGSRHAQVRILVDDTHYLKGMAVYTDDIPDGVDVVFNTNKTKGTPMEKVLKPIDTSNPDNPFGSLIKEKGGQSYYYDEKGEKKLSLINKRADEGDWSDWKDRLPSQFLAKQSTSLIKKQINLAIADKQAEYDEICALTNPTVKKNLLQSFADDCDSTAVHLYAAALPRQKWHVILPISSMKETEVYAPNYKDGEKVALIRYPHGGTFEIPIVTVNNKHPVAKRLLGNVKDAVGINSKVAERLSGADFDGDTVMVIPTHDKAGKVKITSTPPLKGLEGFDPKMEYGTSKVGDGDDAVYYRNGVKVKTMSKGQIGKEMGVVSNLITDMTLKGATQDELARAVRHSMVVIDAYKHKLDYKQSAIDNGIDSLKRKYQAHDDDDGYGGASTLISRAKSETSVLKRKGSPIIDKETGEQSWKTVHEEYVDKNGKVQVRTQKSTKMAETKDARTLISDANTPEERYYAEYANKMKAMANEARKQIYTAGKIEYSAQAKATYQNEVNHLLAQLNVAAKNAPKEREALRVANSRAKAKKQSNPDMDKKEYKKISTQELTKARHEVGAARHPITINDREWEAIQAGAIAETTLSQILRFADPTTVRQYATPRSTTQLSEAKINRIKAMNASNYTTAQIAEALGCSESTVSKYL